MLSSQWLSSEAANRVQRYERVPGHVRVVEGASLRADSLCSLPSPCAPPCLLLARPATLMSDDSSGDEFGTYFSSAVTRPRTSEYG